MSAPIKPLPPIKRFKQRAKVQKNVKGIQQARALDLLSQEFGFTSWKECLSYYHAHNLNN
ncbi:hypothetical protein VCHA54O482_90082 [Vibrio chagasii]|nr:hypothetical protein VCHA36O163_100082 [Vibrio chagasii]CAH6795551.1 hypothetical protein VCHA31O71_100082 [Vibrio chagasii]CAH7441417.1 hypothetical protein VCHA49P382_90090 [Vibrio chagasii]CAH7481586.1 hypothetical protein VCHA54O482_90082 [Vibrio chagasii]